MVRSNKLASFQGQQPDEIYGELGYPVTESLGFAESKPFECFVKSKIY